MDLEKIHKSQICEEGENIKGKTQLRSRMQADCKLKFLTAGLRGHKCFIGG